MINNELDAYKEAVEYVKRFCDCDESAQCVLHARVTENLTRIASEC